MTTSVSGGIENSGNENQAAGGSSAILGGKLREVTEEFGHLPGA